MKKVVEIYEADNQVPFAMRFMEVPDVKDLVEIHASTMTTNYTTGSGPNDSPDDGEVVKKDDE